MGSVTRLQENVMVQDYHRLLQQSLRGLQCVCVYVVCFLNCQHVFVANVVHVMSLHLTIVR